MRTGKRTVATMIGIATATMLVTAGAAPAAKPRAKAEGAPAERGAFIVQVGGCNHCHTRGCERETGMPSARHEAKSGGTSDEPDPEGKAGSATSNLTSDKDTSFGDVDEKDVETTHQEQEHMGGTGRRRCRRRYK